MHFIFSVLEIYIFVNCSVWV